MRTLPLMLLLAACTGPQAADKSVDDSVRDSEVLATVYEPVEPVVPFGSFEIDGAEVMFHFPENMAGLVLMLHGSGGDSGWVEGVEAVDVLNSFIGGDFGFISVQSVDRVDGVYDTTTAPATNPDFQRLSVVRELLIAEARITASTPWFALGFSAGGGMVDYVGHAGVEAGWPVRGLLLHNTAGRSGRYGGLAPLPTARLPARNDPRVGYDSVVERHEEHLAAGQSGVLLGFEELPLEPTRFARYDYISRAESRAVWDAAVSNGLIDSDGSRLAAVDSLEATIDAFVLDPAVTYAKPVTAQLKVVWALHAFRGSRALDELAFLEDAL